MADFFDALSLNVWVWIAAAVVFIIIEAITLGLTSIWFAVGSVASAVTAMFTDNIIIQLAVFVAVSLVLVLITRPIAIEKVNRKTVATNVESLIGRTAYAFTDITREDGGQIKLEGTVWSAVPSADSQEIKKGDTVKILEVKGVKLIVRKELLS
ncbi:MAG: NfeD family protein [Anaerovoracaceae bacterium]|jgi:membrane protein implicated in regulation of membrane protease activity